MTVEMMSCIRGYHECQREWEPIHGDTLECKCETSNHKTRYAVTMLKDIKTVGHSPKKISKICSLFFKGEEALSSLLLGNTRFTSRLKLTC